MGFALILRLNVNPVSGGNTIYASECAKYLLRANCTILFYMSLTILIGAFVCVGYSVLYRSPLLLLSY